MLGAMSATSTAAGPTSTSSRQLVHLVQREASGRDVAAYLDGLSPEARLAEVLSVTGRGVARLYEGAAGNPTPTLDELIARAAAGVTIYEGRNSLAAFSRFQKRFVRMQGLVVGYNHQTMSFVTGPGYFVVHEASGVGEHGDELDFDYTAAPPGEPAGWPPYTPNERGLSRFVYGNMHDYVRRVARGVVVGKAYRHGVSQNAYFSLTLPE
jgi:hypothetical protein